MPDGQYMARERVPRQKQRLHGPGCSDATFRLIPTILGNSLNYIYPAQTHSEHQKFLKLFTQTKNSQYQLNLIVCNLTHILEPR